MSKRRGFPAQFTPKLITVLREGYGAADLRADIIAGLTVAVVALPLSMAIAIASGVGPERGLITAIVGGFLVSLLGGSRFQIGGPAGAFIVLVAATVDQIGVEGLILSTMIAGALLAAAGVLRLGSYIKFIPYPVTVGFTAGIAAIIFASQIHELLGLTLPGKEPGPLAPKLTALAEALPTANPAAIALSALSIAVILALKRLRPGWPGMLAAVALAGVVASGLDLPVATVGSRFGAAATGLPMPGLPVITADAVLAALPHGAAFALLGAIESLLSAVVADGMTGARHRSNMELAAQGIANVGSALMGGICVTGAIARTATNIRAGARGPVAGMVHAGALLAAVLAAGPLLAHVPLAALAGVLAVVAWNMAERHAFAALLRASKGDALVLLVTFGLTVFRDLTEGIIVGFALGTLIFVHRMAEAAKIETGTPDVGDNFDPALAADPDVAVYRLKGVFFFGAASTVSSVLDQISDGRRAFVMDFTDVPLVDSTAASAVAGVVRQATKAGVSVWIAGASTPVRKVLEAHGVHAGFAPTAADAVATARAAIKIGA
ncbi:MAG: SulP family sulfate permease [Paracoccaceae bacterium]|jgi:SulP family sulfate permease